VLFIMIVIYHYTQKLWVARFFLQNYSNASQKELDR
jgi:hypothetical protein